MATRALIFDVDGTLVETEELHRAAFNRAFAEAGLGIAWDRQTYGRLLSTTGGRRRILRYFSESGLPASDELAGRLHLGKNRYYAEAVASGVELRPGVAELMSRARREGVKLAIATTTSRANVEVLLATVGLPPIDVVVAGEDVTNLKPDPEAYGLALARLRLAPHEALAIEDSANGLMSALAAGLRTIITPSFYTQRDGFEGATAVLPDLADFSWRRWDQSVANGQRTNEMEK